MRVQMCNNDNWLLPLATHGNSDVTLQHLLYSLANSDRYLVSEFDLNADAFLKLEDDVKADLCIAPSLMQRIQDRAAKFEIDNVPKDFAAW